MRKLSAVLSGTAWTWKCCVSGCWWKKEFLQLLLNLWNSLPKDITDAEMGSRDNW